MRRDAIQGEHMRPKSTKAKKSSKPKSRRRTEASRGLMKNTGLRGFAIDVSQKSGQKALARVEAAPGGARSVASTLGVDLKKLDPETAARTHLDQALASDELAAFSRPRTESANSEFKSLGSEAVPLTGTVVVKFCQRFHKIPVYGSLVTVELDKDNGLLGINSTMGSPSGVDHVAKISPAQALAVAAKAAGARASSLSQTPRLYYYFDQNTSKWRLAYIIENVTVKRPRASEAGHSDAALKDYVIDAQTGKLLAELPRIATMARKVDRARDSNDKLREIVVDAAGGKRSMRDLDLNVTTYGFDFNDPTRQSALLPGALYTNPPNPWPSEAVDAHANGAEVARFLRDVVKRSSIDGRGGEMISTVNCWDRADGVTPAREWKNAYWNGDQMVYGQIKFPNQTFYSVAAMLDVVGHEMFHGVTDYTSRLEYRTQPGALNESYSDIFGVIIANFAKPIARWSWRIGVGFEGPGKALRDLADPTRHDQPKHMRDFRTATPPYTYERNDYGWVHDNSGIHNFAAYKIMTAKAGSRYVFSKSDIAGMFFLALTTQLSRTSDFSDSRRGVIQAARSLFRGQSAAVLARKVKAVEDGFAAAGIT